MSRHKNGLEKREAFLDAASGVFVEKGYAQATVAQISQHAGGNIPVAAVYYSSGTNKALYIAVWNRAFTMADLAVASCRIGRPTGQEIPRHSSPRSLCATRAAPAGSAGESVI